MSIESGQSDRGNPEQLRLFLACFVSLVATAFGFAIRAAILEDWRVQFNLSNEQIGYIGGAGLFPFAISIILFSLVVDKVGYGRSLWVAFFGHVLSAIITIFATNFVTLYLGTFIFALSNGVVEAVINPVVATVYARNKTHWLNILHAGWPGGLVLGGLLAIAIAAGGTGLRDLLPGNLWQWQVALVLLPTLVYGVLLVGVRFPVQERVAAGVTYLDMLKEFGTASCYIVCFLLVGGLNQVLTVLGATPISLWVQLAVAVVPTVLFGLYVKSFGRPMFVFLLLVMFLLATTELGTDSWIADIMRAVLASPVKGTLFLVYTSFIMFVLRFFAGPIVHRISPLGLLALSATLACVGLLWLSNAGSAALALFLAATVYGFGKTFFWPTTLGVVSEQYPKGGALMLNAIAGVGMLSVGILGNPGIGYVQDQAFDRKMKEQNPELHQIVTIEEEGIFGKSIKVDQEALRKLDDVQRQEVDEVTIESKQGTLGQIAVLPVIMLLCYIVLIVYFRSQGGYQAAVLTGHMADDEEFTGGVEGPVE